MLNNNLEEIKRQLNEVSEAFARACEEYGILRISVDGNTIFEKQQGDCNE